MTNTKHTHENQIDNMIDCLETLHTGTRWQTEQGFNDSLRAIEYAKSPIIAAAPEMLKALEAVEGALHGIDTDQMTGKQIRACLSIELNRIAAAIAKATKGA